MSTVMNQRQSREAKPGPPRNREQAKGKHQKESQGEAGEGCVGKRNKGNNPVLTFKANAKAGKTSPPSAPVQSLPEK